MTAPLVIPQAPEAEEAVLGALLTAGTLGLDRARAVTDDVRAVGLEPCHFFGGANGKTGCIYSAPAKPRRPRYPACPGARRRRARRQPRGSRRAPAATRACRYSTGHRQRSPLRPPRCRDVARTSHAQTRRARRPQRHERLRPRGGSRARRGSARAHPPTPRTQPRRPGAARPSARARREATIRAMALARLGGRRRPRPHRR